MAQEIERKFLVRNDSYKRLAKRCLTIRQGYLSRDPESTVRVRLIGDEGKLTVKGITRGCSRAEFEYCIPEKDALRMLELCKDRIISKERWIVPGTDGKIWEVDEFQGDLAPLVVAEIELSSETEIFELPGFVGEEVTGNPAYYNSSL